eukprot:13465712-Ditylum_brightwellii.AAC.1
MEARLARWLNNSLQTSAHHNQEELEPIKITPSCTPNLQSSYPIRGKTSDAIRTINQVPKTANLSLTEWRCQSIRNSSFGRNNIGLQKPNYSIAPTGSSKTSLRNGYMHESMQQKNLDCYLLQLEEGWMPQEINIYLTIQDQLILKIHRRLY